MKKSIIIVMAMVCACLVVNAQSTDNDNNNRKQHFFGIGTSANLCTGNKHMDGFSSKLNYFLDSPLTMDELTLFIHSQSSWNVFVDYQWELNDIHAFAARVKFSSKDIEYAYLGHPRAESSFYGQPSAHINSWEIPLTYRPTIFKTNDFKLAGVVGPGIVFYDYSDKLDLRTFNQDNHTFNGGHFSLNMDRSVDFFVNVGIVSQYKFANNMRLEFSLLYNWYPQNNNFQYVYYNPGGFDIKNFYSDEFDNNYLSASIAFYFLSF